MTYTEKTLQCADCGQSFAFTAGEQEFYASKLLANDPKRCPSCRQAKKAQQYGNNGNSYRNDSYGNRSPRQMFPVKCSECGKDTEVPFEPRNDRPVYCSDCYRKVKLAA
ncbi:MAG: zinc-ribbon domain containing protein [Dehalococcoidales bacterium]|nr:zinc-ribbon domain containing protein [Dehalococcoidales bacterium]